MTRESELKNKKGKVKIAGKKTESLQRIKKVGHISILYPKYTPHRDGTKHKQDSHLDILPTGSSFGLYKMDGVDRHDGEISNF